MDDGQHPRRTYETIESLRQSERLSHLLAAVVAAPIAVAVAYVLSLPATILPGISLSAIAAAALVALVAWRMRSPRGTTFWNLSGVLALVGCVAAMLSQPEHVVEFFDIANSQN